MKTLSAFIAACVIAFTGLQAFATIGVGSSVADISYTSAQGEKVDIGALKGKLVLIDFWATWCGPCMHEAPHMVSINQKYGSKGLVVLGISLDRDAGTMLTGAKGAGLTWPQVIDGGKYSGAFGVDSIPRTFLVGPDGKVLWTGHPAGGLDAAIDDAFKNHPPFMVDPAIVAEATKLLDQASAKLDANDPKAAMKLMSKIPPAAKADDKFATRSTEVQKKLEAAGEAMLAEVDPLIAKADYKTAVAHLKEVSEGLNGLPVAQKAKKTLLDLTSKPEVKTALAEADKAAKEEARQAHASEALAAATKLQADKKDELAYVKFKAVAADFSGTPAAATAAEQIKKYDLAHPEIGQKLNDSATASKAKSALSMAASYERSGRADLAKAKYQSVIDAFPNTEYAETAKKGIEKLAGE